HPPPYPGGCTPVWKRRTGMEPARQTDHEEPVPLAEAFPRLARDQHSAASRWHLRAAGVSDDDIVQPRGAGRIVDGAPEACRPWVVKRSGPLQASAARLSARAPALI